MQNWYVTDDPASAQWHYSGCELVLGKDKRNKPIINRAITFVGTFEAANPSSTDESSSCDQPSSSSLNQPRPLFQVLFCLQRSLVNLLFFLALFFFLTKRQNVFSVVDHAQKFILRPHCEIFKIRAIKGSYCKFILFELVIFNLRIICEIFKTSDN